MVKLRFFSSTHSLRATDGEGREKLSCLLAPNNAHPGNAFYKTIVNIMIPSDLNHLQLFYNIKSADLTTDLIHSP